MPAFVPAIFALLIAPFNGWAGIPPTGPVATKFYRNTQSLFPSGQAPRAELEKKLKSQEFHHSYKISWNHENFWVEAQDLVREIHCADRVLLNENSQLLERDQSSAKSVQLAQKDQELELLQLKSYWAQVKDPKTQQIGWLPEHRLRIKTEDLGVFVNLLDTYLRSRPQHYSGVVTTVPKAQRLKILGFDNGFLKTEYRGFSGFVDLSHLVSRVDFAVWALHTEDDEKKWILVSHRSNEFLVSKDKKRHPIVEFASFSGNPSKAVVLESESSAVPLRSHVQILESQAHQWGLSLLSGHGLVWWKKSQEVLNSQPKTTGFTITTDELLRRSLFSMALESGKTVRGLVSAKGVFKTEDGIKWEQISQFGDQDLPVTVDSNGTWYVGSFRSLDRGKNFEPFIRWDHLAQVIEQHIGRHPKQIRLQKIESLTKGELRVMVDTGPGHVNLKYQIPNSAWSVVK